MLNTELRKRIHPLVIAWVMSVFLIAVAAVAATELIDAKRGGRIEIDEGLTLTILPKALSENTEISVNIKERENGQLVFLQFEPDGLTFADNKPARLFASRDFIGEGSDLTLYTSDGTAIKPKPKRHGAEWELDHFSLYYFRRR